MIGWLALASVAALAFATSPQTARETARETGARDWRGELAQRNARQARKVARQARKTSGQRKAPRVRAGVDCCAAESDSWREARGVYARWAAPSPMTYREALQVCWRESHEAVEAGDYSKPADRRCALGKLHANKLAQWKDCRETCARAGLGSDPLTEAFAGAADFVRWSADDGTGGTLWAVEGGSDVVRVAPFGASWRVDIAQGSAWRFVDSFDDEDEADEAARQLLDTPF